MPLLSRKRVLLAKTETTYGTDATPTGAANAVLVRNMDITPIVGESISRDLIRPYLGASEQLQGDQSVQVTFEVEMAGAGTAGELPAYDALLKACGMSVVDGTTDVAYSPISTGFPSLTLYYNVDGVLHKIRGARGNVQMSITSGQIPVFSFTFTGLYTAPTDTSLPTVDFTAWQTPLAANSTNTSGFSLLGYSGVLQSLEINFNNAVDYRSLIGSNRVDLTDRSVSGTAVFEAPTLAVKDYFAAAIGNSLGSLAITHGITAGNKVEITSARVDVQAPTYQDNNGVHMLSVPFVCIPSSSGNDEISIVVK